MLIPNSPSAFDFIMSWLSRIFLKLSSGADTLTISGDAQAAEHAFIDLVDSDCRRDFRARHPADVSGVPIDHAIPPARTILCRCSESQVVRWRSGAVRCSGAWSDSARWAVWHPVPWGMGPGCRVSGCAPTMPTKLSSSGQTPLWGASTGLRLEPQAHSHSGL